MLPCMLAHIHFSLSSVLALLLVLLRLACVPCPLMPLVGEQRHERRGWSSRCPSAPRWPLSSALPWPRPPATREREMLQSRAAGDVEPGDGVLAEPSVTLDHEGNKLGGKEWPEPRQPRSDTCSLCLAQFAIPLLHCAELSQLPCARYAVAMTRTQSTTVLDFFDHHHHPLFTLYARLWTKRPQLYYSLYPLPARDKRLAYQPCRMRATAALWTLEHRCDRHWPSLTCADYQ
jgi:hypothetical protein